MNKELSKVKIDEKSRYLIPFRRRLLYTKFIYSKRYKFCYWEIGWL